MIAGENKREQGFILFPLLLLMMICLGIIVQYIRAVALEIETVKESLRYRQLGTIAQSFMQTALYQEKKNTLTNAVYPLGVLMPGNENVNIIVNVNQDQDLGMRFLKVTAADSSSGEYSLRQCRIRFSESFLQQFSQSLFVVMGSGEENQSEKNRSITCKTNGAVFPQFSVESISNWTSTDFPSAFELQHDGLSKWIYLCKERLSLPDGLRVNGDGILVFGDDITIGDNSIFTGRLVILADKNVRIGRRVRMDKVLLLCKGKLTVGSDSFINGAALIQQNSVLGARVTLKEDKEVLNPFDSIISS